MVKKLLVFTKRITSWSWSRIRDYEACAYYAALKHVLGIKEPGSKAMQRGSDIGKMAEQYIKGEIRTMPPELQNFAAGFKELRAYRKRHPDRVVVEETWAFRKDWSRTKYNDWEGCVCRIKMDVARVIGTSKAWNVDVIDHKTGKYNPEWDLQDYFDQLDLYATGALAIYGHLPNLTVTAKLWFLDYGIEHPAERVYTIADLPDLKKRWEARARPMLDDKRFRPMPSRKCQYCYFRAGNAAEGGGQCTH